MWNYSKEVMDHFMNPRNVGEIENPDGVGEVGNAACGDALKLTSTTLLCYRTNLFFCLHAISSLFFTVRRRTERIV